MRYTGGFGSFSVTALRPTTWYWRMATICTQAMRERDGGDTDVNGSLAFAQNTQDGVGERDETQQC